MSKPGLILEIEGILGRELHPSPIWEHDPLGSVIPKKAGLPRYLWDEGKLVGLNLVDTGLTDTKWDQITALPGLAEAQLKVLNLSENQLTEFRVYRGMEQLQVLNLADNPLIFPEASVLQQGQEFTLRFLKQILTQGEREVYEVKMLIVGEGGTGKTTLWHKLQNPDHPVPLSREEQPMTVGIEIKEGWEFVHQDHPDTPFLVNLWDFGGQEIQYMTHQFFLTKRSFYVLLADGRKEVANFSYWFKIINLLGCEGTQEKPMPVLVVLNERGNPIAQMPYDPVKAKTDYPHLDLLKREVDLALNDGRFTGLVQDIQEILCKRIEHLPLRIPRLWDQVRRDLNNRKAKGINHIEFKTFREICESHGIREEQQMLDLSQLFHDLGVVLHYQEDARLANFMILNPEWAVQAIYEIMRHKAVVENQGRFDEQLLKEVWAAKGYTLEERGNLMSLMLKNSFEVCFGATERGRPIYIAPQLLPDVRPDFEWSSSVGLVRHTYQYPFMPKGLIGRLIVRLHEYLEGNEAGIKVLWKDGMVIAMGESRALIQETQDSQTGGDIIEIEIVGPDKEECRYVLRRIRQELTHIHDRSFPALRFEEKIPCYCQECNQSPNAKFFNLSELERRLAKGKSTIECGNSFEDISVGKLLEGVNGNNSINVELTEAMHTRKRKAPSPSPKPSKNQKPKGFISYARAEDHRYLEEFRKGIQQHSEWDLFTDNAILMGEDWEARLQQEVQSCDFGILLLSPGFFKSDYIKHHELAHFLERNEENGFPLFSVLLSDCDFRQWPEVARKQFFTAEGQHYDLSQNHRDKQISFDMLIRFDEKGSILPNPYRNTFCKHFVEKVNQVLNQAR